MAHHLGHQHHLDGGEIERQVGVARPQRGERPDHAQPQGDVGFEQVMDEQARAGLGADPRHDVGDLAAQRQRHRRFVEQPRQRRQRRRPERAERVVRGAADGVVLEPRRDGRHQIQARRLGGGGDGVRGDLGILVGDQRRQIGQLRADVAGQAAEQHRRLDAGAAPFRAALAGHRPEQHARRFEVLVAAGPAVERDHAGADREVGEVAEGVDLGQRIDLGVVRQPEQRLGPHLDVGIVQQPLGLGPDRQVGGGPQRGQGPGADGGRLVGQERADGVEGRPPPALREGPQDVEDRLGIAGVEGLGQHRRGRSNPWTPSAARSTSSRYWCRLSVIATT